MSIGWEKFTSHATHHWIEKLPSCWRALLESEFQKPYLPLLWQFLQEELLAGASIFPPQENVFHALKTTPLKKVRAVILGQDPYHGKGQAHGLCFSVPKDQLVPPSLRNIFSEVESDLDISLFKAMPIQGDLTNWAKEGVLLLNTILTVREDTPGAHAHKGWERLTDRILEEVAKQNKAVVFLLWGKAAQEKSFLLDQTGHLILTASHPSPLSAYRGFLGCKHFSQANEWLTSQGSAPIHWEALVSSGGDPINKSRPE